MIPGPELYKHPEGFYEVSYDHTGSLPITLGGLCLFWKCNTGMFGMEDGEISARNVGPRRDKKLNK